MNLIAYTDGACKGNPGPGGWGAILVARDQNGVLKKERVLRGYEGDTTNNRMEMLAAISALDVLDRPTKITVCSDSKYVIDGITKWIIGWRARGWKTKDRQPVKNEDLWRRLDELNSRHDVTWKWVKGHNGHKMNERADAIAVEMRDLAAGGKAPVCSCGTPLDEIPLKECEEHRLWAASMWDMDAMVIDDAPYEELERCA